MAERRRSLVSHVFGHSPLGKVAAVACMLKAIVSQEDRRSEQAKIAEVRLKRAQEE
jgi:hypothetical protein